jgi:hypothetical protein
MSTNFKKLGIILAIFFDHNGMKLEINNKKKVGNYANTWKLNNLILNNNGSRKKSRKKLKNFLK